MSYLCGCYYHIASPEHYARSQKHYLPLLDSEAHTTILSTTSRTVLKQTFINPSTKDAISECIYTFPLYDGVSVVKFTCRIGKAVLHGLVKEKVKAKAIFDEAVAKGETAGLLEQAPESSDVFSTKLGNILAGQSVVVEIAYIGELKHHETDGIRFTIPTSIAPRYGSGPSSYGHPSTPDFGGSGVTQNSGGIKIVVDVNMPDGSFIKGVQSPSHPIAISMGTVSTAEQDVPVMSKASATLSLGSAALEKDFVLIVLSKDVGVPKAILETHPTIRNQRALMAILVPKFSLPPSHPEIVFVADRSGSMRGNIEMLVSAMKVFLKSMPAGTKFNICSFGSSFSFLWEKSQTYTKASFDEADRHLATFAANFGGTETHHAIKAVIDRRWGDIPLEIMLLTDGDIWQQGNLFSYVNEQVNQSNGGIRVFPLGIGNGVSYSLIEGLARAGNGFAQAVQHGERLENCVVRMLRGALSPHITDYTLEVKYDQGDDDFEVIDKVTESFKVLLKDPEKFEAETQKPAISLFDTAANPEKDNLKNLEVKLPDIPSPKLLQASHKIPSLFAFSRTAVYLLMSPETIQRNPTAVILRATSSHGPLALEIPIETLTAPAETIHQLAAKKAVQDLEEGRGWIYDAKDQSGELVQERYRSRFDDLVKKEAVRIGEKFQIAGKFCSFVAVQANGQEMAKNEGKLVSPPNNHATISNLLLSGANYTEDSYIGLDSAADARYDSRSSNVSPRTRNQHGWGLTKKFKRMEQQPPTYSSISMGSSEISPSQHQPTGFQSMSAFGAPPLQPQMTGQYRTAVANSFGNNSSPPALVSRRPLSHSSTGAQMSSQASNIYQRGPPPSSGNPFGSSSGPASFTQPAVPNSNSVQATGGMFGSSSTAAQPYVPANFRSAPVSSQSQASVRFGPSTVASQPQSGGGLFGGLSAASQPQTGGGLFGPIPVASQPQTGGLFGAPSATKIEWSIKSPADKVIALIAIQDFEGSWVPPTEADEIMCLDVPENPKASDQKVWITLVVVCYLEQKMASQEGTWALVVDKARGWLASLNLMNLNELEKEATEFVKKH